jgi:hypothetical protein
MRLALSALTLAALLAAPAAFAPVWAKLPAPSDEAKAKAAAAAAKTAWSDKVGNYQLCQAMNRVAEQYRKSAKADSKEPPPAVETPACADPGPFVAVAATPPLEAAGAHSPPATAVAPPSGKATAAELQGQPKK